MKRSLLAIAMVFGWAVEICASAPTPLATLSAVHALSNDEASRALPVDFEATITYLPDYEKAMFVQDGGDAIYVEGGVDPALKVGDRVLVKGATEDSFRPYIVRGNVTLVHHGPLPEPIRTAFAPLIQVSMDCMYVKIHGVVRSAEPVASSGRRVMELNLAMEDGEVDIEVDRGDPARLERLLDSTVEVTGVVGGRFDGKLQQTGIILHAATLDDVKILKDASVDPETLPLTPMDLVLNTYEVQDRSRRIHVQGTITYFQPGSMAVLQDGSRSIRVYTPEVEPLRLGDRAEATGFPMVDDGFLALKLGKIRPMGAAPAITPPLVTWDDLDSGKYAFDLVSVEGEIVSYMREEAQDVYVIRVGSELFTAVLRHPYVAETDIAKGQSPLLEIRAGSKVRATGVAIIDNANPFSAFGILLRSSSDLAVIAEPSWLSVDNLIIVVGLLLVAFFAMSVRGWSLERKVRRQATALAARIETEANLERRRSRILEDINGSRPLSEIVEQITELVSFKLGGVPCWCQVNDGARLGAFPSNADPRCVIQIDVLSRSEQTLGILFACLPMPVPATAEELEALSMGAGLVELAMEARRLYSDLRHRSEFDLLTEIHNRFSLEKHLDALISRASQNASVFGLIYIDLDGFKQVNDLHGHRTGDLYLQEVALRMKRQLRAGDMLARLGGDEFAAMAPTVRSRADVEDVANRLERCFDDPFTVEGVLLRGSASVGIALYPEDGKTRDGLLNAADAAMYVAKHAHKQIAREFDVQPEPRVSPAKRP